MNTAATTLPDRHFPTDVAEREHWQILVVENNTSEDALWATPDGRLFLWQEPSRLHEPREVALEQAAAWFQKFHQADPGWCSICFPEDSDAFRFTELQAEAIKKRDVARSDELAAAINAAEALCVLFQERLLAKSTGSSYGEDIQCGLVELESATFNRLRQASQGVN